MTCPHCSAQHPPSVNNNTCAAQDDRAAAYYTGAADARYGRPRRVDLADRGPVGAPYNRGYDAADTRGDEADRWT